MKKSALALGVIVALGAVWTGGAWYTGTMAETEWQRQIDISNQKLAQQGENQPFQLRIEHPTFQRSIFSSDVTYDVVLTTSTKEQFVFPFEGKLYHGPLPLNQVTKFNLVPAMFSATSQLVKNESNAPFFQQTKGKNPIFTEWTVSYSKNTKGIMDIAANQFDNAQWSDIHGEFDIDAVQNGTASIVADKIQFSTDLNGSNEIKKLGVNLDKLNLKYSLKNTDLAYILLGDMAMNIGKLQYNYEFKDGVKPTFKTISVTDQSISMNATQQDQWLAYKLKLNNSGTQIDDKNVGAGTFNLSLSHLPADVMNSLIQSINENKQDEYYNLWTKLLHNQPQLQIDPLQFRNEGGKIEAKFNLEIAESANELSFFSLIKQLELAFNADKKSVEHLFSFALQLEEGEDKAAADEIAVREVESMVKEFAQENIVVDNGNQIDTLLKLDNSELKLNGKVIPREQVEEQVAMYLLFLGLYLSQ